MKFWNWIKEFFGLSKVENCECCLCIDDDAKVLKAKPKKKSKKRK